MIITRFETFLNRNATKKVTSQDQKSRQIHKIYKIRSVVFTIQYNNCNVTIRNFTFIRLGNVR